MSWTSSPPIRRKLDWWQRNRGYSLSLSTCFVAQCSRLGRYSRWSMDLPPHAGQDGDYQALHRYFGPRRGDRGGTLGARPGRPRPGRAGFGRGRKPWGPPRRRPFDTGRSRSRRPNKNRQLPPAPRRKPCSPPSAPATSGAREALRAAQAEIATKNQLLPGGAGAPAGGLPLVPGAPAVGLPAAPVPPPALDLVFALATPPARSRSRRGPGGPGTRTFYRGVSPT